MKEGREGREGGWKRRVGEGREGRMGEGKDGRKGEGREGREDGEKGR